MVGWISDSASTDLAYPAYDVAYWQARWPALPATDHRPGSQKSALLTAEIDVAQRRTYGIIKLYIYVIPGGCFP